MKELIAITIECIIDGISDENRINQYHPEHKILYKTQNWKQKMKNYDKIKAITFS